MVSTLHFPIEGYLRQVMLCINQQLQIFVSTELQGDSDMRKIWLAQGFTENIPYISQGVYVLQMWPDQSAAL